jgi:plastocyanin
MKRLMYLIPLAAVAVLLLATPALTQTAPNDIALNPTQTTDAVQETGGAATDPTTAPAESTTPAPNSTTVNIHDHTFDPAQLNIAPGTTVTWTNGDTEAHTVTADDGLFDSGVLEPGQSYSTWLGGSGTVSYHCDIHPDMKGSVVVGGASGGETTGGETTTGDPGSTPPDQAASVYP